jgi:hypothetical protein
MKRITFLLLLLPAFTLTSCSDGDENEPMQVFPDVAATYKLINVSGSIAGVSHDFAPGTITWRFNTNQTVTVVNNNTNENVEDFFGSGTYEFSLQPFEYTPAPCDRNLVIDSSELGCAEITENGLVLTQAMADGYVLTFVK